MPHCRYCTNLIQVGENSFHCLVYDKIYQEGTIRAYRKCDYFHLFPEPGNRDILGENDKYEPSGPRKKRRTIYRQMTLFNKEE